jgi:hypothetical protein
MALENANVGRADQVFGQNSNPKEVPLVKACSKIELSFFF